MKEIVIGVMLLGAGAVGYWLLSPLWRTERVDEAVPEAQSVPAAALPSNDQPAAPAETSELAELFAGNFVGFDRFHQGSGTAKIIQLGEEMYVRFESDFSVSNGPDLFVGFGKDGQYSAGSELGALKGNVGAQNYALPGGFDATRFNEVYVWCRAFSVPFAKARLTKL